MRTNQTKILAIDPSTKHIGVAVLSGVELIYFGVKTIRQRQSKSEVLRQARQIISRLIADHQPNYIALEKASVNQQGSRLWAAVVREIKTIPKAQDLPVFEYAPASVRKQICQSAKATKKMVAEKLAGRYSELRQYLENRTKWEALYYGHLFDAIAVGLMCHRELSEKSFMATG